MRDDDGRTEWVNAHGCRRKGHVLEVGNGVEKNGKNTCFRYDHHLCLLLSGCVQYLTTHLGGFYVP